MQSRMDRYNEEEKPKYERSKKNTKLYEDVYDDMYRDTTYKNMEVIDSAKEINLNRLQDILNDKYDNKQYRTLNNYSLDDIEIDDKPIIIKDKNKIHDINEIIDKAKSKRSFLEEAKEKQKYINFTKGRRKKYDKKYEEMEQDEKELEELINTMAIEKPLDDTASALDMFSELKGNENTIVTNPIDTSFDIDVVKENTKTSTEDIRGDLQKTLVKADKTFYTGSNMFTKNDFEDFSTLTKELRRSSRIKKAIIILIVLAILGVATYFALTKYILK